MQAFTEMKAELQNLSTAITGLKNNTAKLTKALTGVQQFSDGVQRDIKKWQFKTTPRLNRIQIILDVLKIDAKENK
ncbi:hypothetical protein [Limosilactobacillus caccae]|jgi:hypothetical protein|uniref:hypothetical protein n=1 Tax=Limosilactobacillus caccae TaxID=1926284 RepID=UPI000970761E|nr:hypothetical protein [Limosilactobacillus caccae]